MKTNTIFLKLGGSLITEKTKVSTARLDVLARLAEEIRAARDAKPGIRLVVGHGSGSFGHLPAKKYNTRAGVHSAEQWTGFIEVWRQAAALNRIVMDALSAANLPAIAFPPSACVMAIDGTISSWDIAPIDAALSAGGLPVIYGDAVFDSNLGGTILSTEDLLVYLAAQLKPKRILLAGDEAGIYESYATKTSVIAEITPTSYLKIAPALGGSAGADVTGGMASKVKTMLDLIQSQPDIGVNIFSGLEVGNLQKTLQGEQLGTVLKS